MRIQKNDQVQVMTGKDRGKKGRVMKVYPALRKVLVEKINYRTAASRPTRDNPKGGLMQMETPIDISNVKLICPRCGKPAGIQYLILTDKTKQRSCKLCHEVLGG